MQLVLKYFGSGVDGRGAERCFPVEAESKRDVFDTLKREADHALQEGRNEFVAFNKVHYLHNFLWQVSPAQMDMVERVAKSRGRPAPTWYTRGDCVFYRFSPVALQVLTPLEWFATESDDGADAAEHAEPTASNGFQ